MSTLKVDDKTGLHLKEQEFTKAQDMAKVNPAFYNFDTNTKNNCALCTVAYDMRRRGYDVAANKAGDGYVYEELSKWYKGVKFNSVGDVKSIKQYNKEHKGEGLKKSLYEEAEKSISKDGDGARGQLLVQWKHGWHSIAYEVENGKVQLYDCQINKKCSLKRIVRQCYKVDYSRLDNLQFNPKTIKEAVH